MRLTNSVMISVACLGFFTTLPTTAWANEPDKVSDEWCGVSLAVPKPWARAAFKGYAVPGVLRCAWAGKGTSSLLVFVQEPGTAVDPRAMLDASTAAQKAKLGAEVIAQEIRTVGGMRAMWMAVKGKGTGGAIDGKGEVDTVQHWIAVPQEKDVLVVLLTCPAADYEEAKKSLEGVVGSLKLSGSQSERQRGAK